MKNYSLLIIFAAILSLLLSPLLTDTAYAQKNTQIFNKDKKMCYLVLAGGDDIERDAPPANDPDKTLLAATSMGAELNFLKDQAQAGSTSRHTQVDDQEDFTNEINSLKTGCGNGDEAVIFFFGHQGKDGQIAIYEQKKVDDKIKPKIADIITAEELKQILSGFQKGTTVSFYTGGCTGDAAKGTVEKAVDDKGDPYGDNFNYWGSKTVVGTNEWPTFKLPLGDETGNKFPDVGNDDGITTTEEYEDGLKTKKPSWFLSFGPSPEVGEDLACLQDSLIGGELLPIDNTSLFLAGIQSMTVWMVPTVLGLVGAGVYLVKFRKH